MYIFNSQPTSKDNKVKQKKNIENRFQLKTGQIRGQFHAIPFVNKFLELSVVDFFFNLFGRELQV